MSFEVNPSKFKGQTGHKKVLTAQYLGNPLHVLIRRHLLCVINSSHTFRLIFHEVMMLGFGKTLLVSFKQFSFVMLELFMVVRRVIGIVYKTLFFPGLHKVHPAYRMVNAGRAGVFNSVPTLCNQLLPRLLADILLTLHSCDRHNEDVHVTFWKYSDIFRVQLSHFSSMF
jgi:hypothetical protein